MKGKHLIFLGSSVTYGSASGGVSFADIIAVRNDCTITKEAVSGTTLVDEGEDSYISRLKKLDKSIPADLFICQLSTNDATQGKPLGQPGTQDTKTVGGAIEYIIDYVRRVWGCPVVFYTNPRYDSPEYGEMVFLLLKIAEKQKIAVIDMWNDTEFNALTDAQRCRYMADAIHPTREGYLEWWTPYMEAVIGRCLGGAYENGFQ